MCMQVAAIKFFPQNNPPLIIILLAPGCPKDNVSIDEHLLTHDSGALFVLLWSSYLFILINFDFNIQITFLVYLSDIPDMLHPSSSSSGIANVSLLLICLVVPLLLLAFCSAHNTSGKKQLPHQSRWNIVIGKMVNCSVNFLAAIVGLALLHRILYRPYNT